MYLKNLKEKEGKSEMQSNIKLTKDKDNCAKQKGITLIALVVTIVVLLILAGVSVNALLGDSGIIGKAKEAQNKMNEAKESDLEEINKLTNWIDSKVNGTTEEPTQPEGKVIKFKLQCIENKIKEYEAIEGMTWKEWMKSDYSKSNSDVRFEEAYQEVMFYYEYVNAQGSSLPTSGYIEQGSTRVKASDTIIENVQYSMGSCLVKGTLIEVEEEEEDEKGNKKKRRKKKRIEDLTYNDNLVVWNFDEGKFDVAKPLWLMREYKTVCYNLLKFSDGSELKTIEQHRIFNKELGKFTYPMTDETPIGTTTFNVNGEEVKLISKEVITEPVEYYNLISYYHMNVFAEGILTSCRFNNLYEIKDMKFIKDERQLVGRDEYKEIPDEYYYGLRLAEQPKEVNRENDDKHANSIESHIKNVYIATAKTKE